MPVVIRIINFGVDYSTDPSYYSKQLKRHVPLNCHDQLKLFHDMYINFYVCTSIGSCITAFWYYNMFMQ